ncbi:hypothetical protein SAMN05444410_1046 [Hydrobacter penzbergensis]|uniref:YD repeat-containing protein n=1 Tax=Hydrobacter penzbergensis TaxID=1235997 RepID=A0A8X8IFW8_9BACT|nr:hypothetical protein [Hydrobacter penzbergensis]SDW57973.1 hypothetical protein SAMN05444410_1046 [Hydrobacter penzbergensis]
MYEEGFHFFKKVKKYHMTIIVNLFKKQFLLPVFVLIISVCKSQVENRNLFPTPNAASLGMYGQVPVDYFTGLPQIDMPIYKFKSGSISIPVHLSYHAGGIKPADHASWVGQGWTLQAGGAITRIINDLPDEWINMALAYLEASSYPDVPSSINANKNGFFYNYGILGDNYWSSTTLNTDYQLLYPATQAISSSQDNAYKHRKDKAPDEFAFNFLGMSGSLFMGQDGLWKMKSKQGLNFKVDYVTGPYLIQDPNCTFSGSTIYNCLTRFILTGNDGTKYYFGADTISNIHATQRRYGTSSGSFVQDWGLGNKNFLTGDSTAIEFTRINPGGGDALKGRDGGTVPMTWYLTKIKSPTGDSVTFKYTRDGYQIINNPGGSQYQYTCNNCYQTSGGGGSTTGADDQLSILDGVSLASINGTNGSLNFSKSKANILDYTLVGLSLPQATLNLFCAYGYELFNGTMPTCASSEVASKRSTFMKLDSINVISNSKNLESFYFRYTENANNRLFLDSLMVKGSDNISVAATRFAYNNKAALAGIPYETVKIDHWGYYNGVNPLCSYFSSPSSCSGTFNWQNLLNPAITNYYNSRTPNQDSMQLGILTSIIYPTGGNTQFIWEPNTYSKTLTQNVSGTSFSVTPTDQNNTYIAAGVRIKQINSSAGFNAPVLTKNYLYYRDYIHRSFLSSGVLNGAAPNYIDNYSQTGQFSYTIWTSYNRTPMHLTNGSLLTYTDVIEQNNDGSMKEYIYSNHDNGYSDRVPVSSEFYKYSNFNFQDYQSSSTELERGLLLQENTYNQGSALLLKKSYQYNNNPNRFTGAVRRYLNVNKFALAGSLYSPIQGFFPGGTIYQGAEMYALEIYTHYPFLQSDTTVQYDQNGLNPLTTINSYTYDTYRNRKTTTTYSSKGETLLSTINYCNDSITGLSPIAQQGKSIMMSTGMSAIPLETIVTRNNNPMKYNRIDYKSYPVLNPFPVPGSSYEANGSGSTEQKAQYINYTNRGNILEYIDRNGIPVSFDWGYNKEYPIVKAINVANTLHDSVYTYNTSIAAASPSSAIGVSVSSFSSSVTFTQSQAGTITISVPASPPGAQVNTTFTLSGASSQSGSLCTAGGGTNCSTTPSSITYNNMPAGVYTLSFSCSTTFQSYSFSYYINYSYIGVAVGTVSTGIKEFFYEGFEESSLANILSDLPHTGKYYLNANYTTSYAPPNARSYIIQWWNFANGKWNLNQQAYTNGMVLTGPVDDIRIFPVDAQMNTYTYEPMKGISSMWDANNKISYYEYDAVNRLSIIRDQDKNIIKRFNYQYQAPNN